MKCNDIREMMPDLAAGRNAATPEVNDHIHSCAGCEENLKQLRQTMALLDEWQAPEPSPYFDTRLRARVREEAAKQPVGWFQWMRRPALAVSLALVMVVGITLFQNDAGKPPIGPPVAEIGTAVGDLQALDKNQDLYSNFDVLDDLEVQPDVTANP
jgi:predicted anti-sigma-YlaC factor YlaD